MTFQKYVCWRPGWAEKVMDTEALQPPTHVFLAVHNPVKMFRTTLSSLYKGQLAERATTLYSERQLLAELLKPQDFAFIPVLGKAGTGKSHLVRWLSVNIPPSEKRHVLLIPKVDTNLRDVLERILRLPGMDGPQFDDYRSRLRRVTSELRTENEAREKLLNNLAVACGENGPHKMLGLNEVQLYLAQNLSNLLYDPFFREPLLRNKGVIDRLVNHTIGNTAGVERLEEKRGFREEDLPLHAGDSKRASAIARDFYNQLIGSEMLQTEAVIWLNNHLSTAIAELLELRGDALFRLMLEVREALAASGKELILLIEDFMKLQGIEMQLLEAIIAKPHQEGHGRLCAMRTVLACTTGYFERLFDTVQTRTDFCVTLDVLPGDRGGEVIGAAEVESFVGRYLNTSRLEERDLEEWHEAVRNDGESELEHTPNACAGCPHRLPCHAAFGATDGIGLYPFTEFAITRMSERMTPEGFNPRILIKDVLKRVLVNYEEDLRGGLFPSGALLEHFKGPTLPASVKADLNRMDPNPISRERRTALLDLWTIGTKVVDLDPGIHEAFALPSLGSGAVSRPEPRSEVPDDKRATEQRGGTAGTSLPVELGKDLQLLNTWQNGDTMPQDLVNRLRELLFDSLDSHINWDAELLVGVRFSGRDAKRPFRQRSINFKRQGQQTSKATIVLELPTADGSFTDAALALQGLLLFAHHKSWNFHYENQPGSYYLRRYARQLEVWAAEVLRKVRAPNGSDERWDPSPAVAELLALAARMAGRPPVSKTGLDDQVGALFQSLDTIDFDHRSSSWRELFRYLKEQHSTLCDILLSRIACTKGGNSKVKAIDASRIAEPLRSVRKDWVPKESIPTDLWDSYSAIRKAREKADSLLCSAIEEERERHLTWSKRIEETIGKDTPRKTLIDTVKATVEAARVEAVYGGVGRERFDETLEAFGRLRFDAFLEALTRIENEKTPGLLLVELGRDYHDAMETSESFISQSLSFLTASLQRVETEVEQLAGAGELKATFEEIDGLLSQLSCLMGTVAGDKP